MELLEILFDAKYVANQIGEGEFESLAQGWEYYKTHGAFDCIPPNEYFARHPELLYEDVAKQQGCRLPAWFITAQKENLELIHHFLRKELSASESSAAFKQIKHNIKTISETNPKAIEPLIGSKRLYLNDYFLEVLAEASDYTPSSTIADYLTQELANTDSTLYKRQDVLQASLNILFKYIIELPLHSDDMHSYSAFITELMVRDAFPNQLKSFILEKIRTSIVNNKVHFSAQLYNNIGESLSCKDTECMYSNQLNLKQDTDLLLVLFAGAELGDYIPDLALLPYAEALSADSNAGVNKLAMKYVCIILADLVSNPTEEYTLDVLENKLLNWVSNRYDISPQLLETTFKRYENFPKFFIELLAEYRLPKEFLQQLVIPVTDFIQNNELISDDDAAVRTLYIMKRLLQNRIELPIDKLCKPLLSLVLHSSGILQRTALNLYSDICTYSQLIPEDITDLLNLYSQLNISNQRQLDEILKEQTLSEVQKYNLILLQHISLWQESDNIAGKKLLLEDICKLVIEKNDASQFSWCWQQLNSQNKLLIDIIKNASAQVTNWQEDLASKEKEVINISNSSVYTWQTNWGSEFLLSQDDNVTFQAKLQRLSADSKNLLQRIDFITLTEVLGFLDFLQKNSIGDEQVANALLPSYLTVTKAYHNLHLILLGNKLPQVLAGKYLVEYPFIKQQLVVILSLGWTYTALDQIFTKITNSSTVNKEQILISSLEHLASYGIRPDLHDRSLHLASDIFSSSEPENWLPILQQLLRDNNFFASKNREELFTELSQLNLSEAALLGLLQNNYLNEKLTTIKDIQENGYLEHNKLKHPLDEWKIDDFHVWRAGLSKITDNNISEVLVVLDQAIKNTQGYHLREVQLIAILSLFKSPHGGLAQIATGEGKSVIIAAFAAIQVLNGRQVDIVTSSDILAERDSDKQRAFYQILGITVSHNIISNAHEGPKICYKADIVYGDLLHFIGDTLRDISSNTKEGRSFDILIVDEVDNLFIDQSNMKVQLASHMPGFEAFKAIQTYMWGSTVSAAGFVRPNITDNTCYTYNFANSVGMELEKSFIPLNKSCRDYLGEYAYNYTRDHLVNDKQLIKDKLQSEHPVLLPKHLQNFAYRHLEAWIDSLLSAIFYNQANIDYLVHKTDSNNVTIIAPVDLDTGTIQTSLHWSYGLHQFLELKHAVAMYSEKLISTFMSYPGFFKKYQGSIYGLTGTLGSKEHLEFLKTEYNVEASVIPTFIPKDVHNFMPIFASNSSTWSELIANNIHRRGLEGRAVLVIVPTIKQVEFLASALISSGYDDSQVHTYGAGTPGEEKLVENAMQPGQVIIASNLAGRGTDLQLSPLVIKNGGLHVILGYFPDSLRVEEQAFGRAARKGEPGSVQIIINNQSIDYNGCDQDIECLRKTRNKEESDRLNRIQLCELPNIAARDLLFGKYVEFINAESSPTGYQIVLTDPGDKLPPNADKLIYLYERNGTIHLWTVKNDKAGIIEKQINLSEIVSYLDRNVAKHLHAVLSKADRTPSSLSKQDYELINFIIASQGFSDYPIVYKRLEAQLYQAATQFLSSKMIDNAAEVKIKKTQAEIEEMYLSHLLRENNQYQDLTSSISSVIIGEKNFPPELITKAKLRYYYTAWIKDRGFYNKENELRQIAELWAIWLFQEGIIKGDNENCTISSEAEIAQLKGEQNTTFSRWLAAFKLFASTTSEVSKNNTLMQNPYYLVFKAWHYVGINDYQSETPQLSESNSQGSWGAWLQSIGSFISGFVSSIAWVKSETKKDYEDKHYKITHPLDEAVTFLDKAIELDHTSAWPAHNALSVIRVLKDGAGITDIEQAEQAINVKRQFVRDTQNALQVIARYVLPQIEAQLNFILMYDTAKISDELVVQLLGTLQLYQQINETLFTNIDRVAKSDGKQMIRIGNIVTLEDLAEKTNITAAALKRYDYGTLNAEGRQHLFNMTKSLNFTSKNLVISELASLGVAIFNVEFYELHEDKDWFGTFLSGFLGIAQIIGGIALIGMGGPFFTTFGMGMVFGGIGDVMGSILSVINKTPIDPGMYFKSKGMSYAITLVTAGIAQIGGFNVKDLIDPKLMGPFQAGTTPAQLPGFSNMVQDLLIKGFVVNAAWAALSPELYRLLDKTVDSNKGNIEASAKRRIGQLFASQQEALRHIFIADDFTGYPIYEGKLLNQAHDIVHQYEKRFRNDGTQFAIGVASSVAGLFTSGAALPQYLSGRVVDSGINAVLGGIKSVEALDEAVDKLSVALTDIANRVPNTAELVKETLARSLDRADRAVSGALISTLQRQQFVVNGAIDYHNCARITQLQFATELVEYVKAVVSACEQIKQMMEADYKSRQSDLERSLVAILTGSVVSTLKNDLIKPQLNIWAKGAMQDVVDHFYNQLKVAAQVKEAQRKTAETYKQKTKEQQTAGQKPQVTKSATAHGKTKQDPTNDNLHSQNRKEQYGPPCPNDICHTRTYEVAHGDNAYNIAKKHGLTVDQLVRSNPELAKVRSTKNGQDYIHLTPGQKLKIPVKVSSTGHTNTYASSAANDNAQKHPGEQYGPMCLNNDCTNYGSYERTYTNDMVTFSLQSTDLEAEYNALPEANKQEVQKNIALVENLHDPGPLEGKLKPVAEKATYCLNQYQKYEQSSPILAKTFLISGMILAKGLTGAVVAGTATGGAGAIPGFLGGLVKGGVDELKGAAFSLVTGDFIGKFIGDGIREYSPLLIKLDSTLSPQEAVVLASIAGAAALSSAEFRSFAKSMHGVDFSGIKIKDGKLDGTFYYKKDIPDTVSKVGPNYPRNADKAGKTYLPDDLPNTIKTTYPNIKLKYPKGVNYDIQGFPDFSPYAIKTVKLDKFTPGNHRKDADRANIEVMKTDPNFAEPKGYTWHHHQDGKTMQLVPGDLHDAFKHTGGMSTTKHRINI